MHISIAQMELAYELLRASLPFRRWRLPPADQVEFHAVPLPKDRLADCQDLGGAYRIRVCIRRCATLHDLLVSLAHEMCHMRADAMTPRDKTHHGKQFRRAAAQVCKQHGFDHGAF